MRSKQDRTLPWSTASRAGRDGSVLPEASRARGLSPTWSQASSCLVHSTWVSFAGSSCSQSLNMGVFSIRRPFSFLLSWILWLNALSKIFKSHLYIVNTKSWPLSRTSGLHISLNTSVSVLNRHVHLTRIQTRFPILTPTLDAASLPIPISGNQTLFFHLPWGKNIVIILDFILYLASTSIQQLLFSLMSQYIYILVASLNFLNLIIKPPSSLLEDYFNKAKLLL